MDKTIGKIHSLETMGTVDGPGIRFVVFLQGCLLRCQYCHNPDTWKRNGGLVRSAEDVFAEAIRYRDFWETSNGGVTVSGGEPLLQMDFLIAFFTLCKAAGIHTTVDTSAGCFIEGEAEFSDKLATLLAVTDLVLLDLKQIDEKKHLHLTKHSNAPILQFARYLSERRQPVWIRHVLVPSKTDDPEDLEQLRDFIATLSNVERIEVLPYHTMGVYKWQSLGIPYALEGVEAPSPEMVEKINTLLQTAKNR